VKSNTEKLYIKKIKKKTLNQTNTCEHTLRTVLINWLQWWFHMRV